MYRWLFALYFLYVYLVHFSDNIHSSLTTDLCDTCRLDSIFVSCQNFTFVILTKDQIFAMTIGIQLLSAQTNKLSDTEFIKKSLINTNFFEMH